MGAVPIIGGEVSRGNSSLAARETKARTVPREGMKREERSFVEKER